MHVNLFVKLIAIQRTVTVILKHVHFSLVRNDMVWKHRGMIFGHGRSLPGWLVAKGTCPAGGTGPLKWTVLWFVGRVGSGAAGRGHLVAASGRRSPTDTLRIWVSA